MFSLVKKVVKSVVPWNFGPPDNLEEEEEEIINCLKTYLQKQEEEVESQIPESFDIAPKKLLGESDEIQCDFETFKLVHKTGKVTHLCEECGLIDDVVYFEPKQISPNLDIKPNYEVHYSAYKAKENESERVFKVYAIKSDTWDGKNDVGFEYLQKDLSEVEVLPALTRVITGRVTRRRGREVYVESADIWCNLDEIEVSYIPVEGDWVELTANVSVDEETADLTGDVLEVKSLKPLLMKSGFGRITLWCEETKEGAIENYIYFTSAACEDGYIPALGDEIVYDAIESDQDRFNWRALNVLVNTSKMSENKSPENKSEINGAEDDPYSDKNGITITPSMCSLTLELNETKSLCLTVSNEGEEEQLLKHTTFKRRRRRSSQLTLKKSGPKENFYIKPKESVTYQIKCTGKCLGLSEEVFIFYFKNFKIAKRIEINVVGDKVMNKLLPCKFDTIYTVYRSKKQTKKEKEAQWVSYGVRPWKPPKFLLKERKKIFNIPKKLMKIAEGDTRLEKFTEAIKNYAPYLKSDLNFEFYADRFHTLLYLEEIEIRNNFKRFELEDVFLDDVDNYFVLSVPGLVEKRPSLIFGDKIVVTQPYLDGGKTKHVGFIYHIQAKEVYIKFHDSFHNTYDGSECNVNFEPNINFFSRCHEAINRAVSVLGEKWLFPTAVNEKPPQINVELPEDAKVDPVEKVSKTKKKKSKPPKKGSPKVKEVESEVKDQQDTPDRVKSLVWVNKNLNERQKLAVVNVLKGQGRPLPYIIFGPPGTGKTITLVEITIQIYRNLPESRILITTPSNSAADLICERLIEMGDFKPGQLVRLLAMYRVFENLVPPKLIPYSTFLGAKENHGKNHSDINSRNNIKGSSFTELAGKHRITVATCTTIGFLHYTGIGPGHFTHILVDEAGQTSEPEVLISASFQDVQKGQVVLTGDPQQLGPVVCSNAAKSFGFGVSLLQRLISTFPYARDVDGFPETSGFDPRFITRLNVNYRSVPEILSLSSQMFYNSDLIPFVSQTKGEEAEIIKKFNFEAENRTTPPAIIFHGVVGQNRQESDSPSWFNPHEIWQTVFYVRKLYSIGLDCDSIGIVSPYAKQVQKLRSLLPNLNLAVPKIGSVEEFQGQERKVIILTTVRSSPKYIKSDIIHSLGFVASPQRLNVALTRARALLIIVGNPQLLSKDPYWVNVVKYCVKNNSYVGCSLEFLGDEIKEEEEKEEESSVVEEKGDLDVAEDGC